MARRRPLRPRRSDLVSPPFAVPAVPPAAVAPAVVTRPRRWPLRPRRGDFLPPPLTVPAAPAASLPPALITRRPRRSAAASRPRRLIGPPVGPVLPTPVGTPSTGSGNSATTTAIPLTAAGTPQVGDVAAVWVTQIGGQPIVANSLGAVQVDRWVTTGNIGALTVLVKRLDAADIAANSVTVTFAASQRHTIGVVVLTNCVGVDAAGTPGENATPTTTGTVPALATGQPDTYILAGIGGRVSTTTTDVTWTWAAPLTELVDAVGTGAVLRSYLTVAGEPAPGAAGTYGPDDAAASTTVTYAAFRVSFAGPAGVATSFGAVVVPQPSRRAARPASRMQRRRIIGPPLPAVAAAAAPDLPPSPPNPRRGRGILPARRRPDVPAPPFEQATPPRVFRAARRRLLPRRAEFAAAPLPAPAAPSPAAPLPIARRRPTPLLPRRRGRPPDVFAVAAAPAAPVLPPLVLRVRVRAVMVLRRARAAVFPYGQATAAATTQALPPAALRVRVRALLRVRRRPPETIPAPPAATAPQPPPKIVARDATAPRVLRRGRVITGPTPATPAPPSISGRRRPAPAPVRRSRRPQPVPAAAPQPTGPPPRVHRTRLRRPPPSRRRRRTLWTPPPLGGPVAARYGEVHLSGGDASRADTGGQVGAGASVGGHVGAHTSSASGRLGPVIGGRRSGGARIG